MKHSLSVKPSKSDCDILLDKLEYEWSEHQKQLQEEALNDKIKRLKGRK